MEIGVDFDDVLMEFMKSFIKYHASIGGSSPRFEEVTDHSLWWPVFGLSSRENAISVVDDFLKSDYACNADPLPEAINVTGRLKSAGHTLRIISSRARDTYDCTQRWLEKTMPGVFSSIHLTNQWNSDGSPSTSKRQLCLELGIEVMVEDHIGNATDCVRQVNRAYLLERPWNRGISLPDRIHPVASWIDLENHLLTGKYK